MEKGHQAIPCLIYRAQTTRKSITLVPLGIIQVAMAKFLHGYYILTIVALALDRALNDCLKYIFLACQQQNLLRWA